MTCFHPISAWQHPAGGKPYFGEMKKNPSDRSIKFPCGQCSGCRLRKSRDWAIRCIHETTFHDQNIFLTLTYNDENLPYPPSLVKEHFTKFMRRYRKYVKRTTGQKIRFYMCGEYGERLGRPHYHAIIFGHDFTDKELYSMEANNYLYISDTLDSLWGKGFCTIGNVTFESAAYVARYILKKQIISEKSSDAVKSHYEKTDPCTGEIFNLEPEYNNMSRKPGIAHDWFQRWQNDVFPSDEITHKGRTLRTPTYYDKLFDQIDPRKLKEVKEQRLERARRDHVNQTPERLAVREKVQEAKLNLKGRNYED